jgi:hypothetical protein
VVVLVQKSEVALVVEALPSPNHGPFLSGHVQHSLFKRSVAIHDGLGITGFCEVDLCRRLNLKAPQEKGEASANEGCMRGEWIHQWIVVLREERTLPVQTLQTGRVNITKSGAQDSRSTFAGASGAVNDPIWRGIPRT